MLSLATGKTIYPLNPTQVSKTKCICNIVFSTQYIMRVQNTREFQKSLFSEILEFYLLSGHYMQFRVQINDLSLIFLHREQLFCQETKSERLLKTHVKTLYQLFYIKIPDFFEKIRKNSQFPFFNVKTLYQLFYIKIPDFFEKIRKNSQFRFYDVKHRNRGFWCILSILA